MIVTFSNFKIGSATSCMGLFLKEIEKLSEKGSNAVFVGLPEKMAALWDMLGLKDFIPLCQTEEEALQILEKSSQKQN